MLAPRQVAGLSICGGNKCPECVECTGHLEGTDDHWYLGWHSQFKDPCLAVMVSFGYKTYQQTVASVEIVSGYDWFVPKET